MAAIGCSCSAANLISSAPNPPTQLQLMLWISADLIGLEPKMKRSQKFDPEWNALNFHNFVRNEWWDESLFHSFSKYFPLWIKQFSFHSWSSWQAVLISFQPMAMSDFCLLLRLCILLHQAFSNQLPVGKKNWQLTEQGCNGTLPLKLTHVSKKLYYILNSPPT